MDKKKKTLNSLNETYRLCQEENYGCSKRQIKRWADDGKIIAMRDGYKYLINWQSLDEYINNSKITRNQPSKKRPQNQLSDLTIKSNDSVSRRNVQIDINISRKKKMK